MSETGEGRHSAYNVENTQSQMRKGFLEFPVLLVIGAGKVYAPDIIETLKKADLLIVEGTLYPLLSRLKRFGLVSYEWEESKSGPPRKYYSITPEGTRVLQALQTSWKSLDSAITKLTRAYSTNNRV